MSSQTIDGRIRTHIIVVADDLPDNMIRQAVRMKADMIERSVFLNDIKVVSESELKQQLKGGV